MFCTIRFMRLNGWENWFTNMVGSAIFGFFFVLCLFAIIVCTGKFLRWTLFQLVVFSENIMGMIRKAPLKVREKIASTKAGFEKEVNEVEEEIKEEIAQTQPGDLSLPETTENEGTLALTETQGTLSLVKKEKNSA